MMWDESWEIRWLRRSLPPACPACARLVHRYGLRPGWCPECGPVEVSEEALEAEEDVWPPERPRKAREMPEMTKGTGHEFSGPSWRNRAAGIEQKREVLVGNREEERMVRRSRLTDRQAEVIYEIFYEQGYGVGQPFRARDIFPSRNNRDIGARQVIERLVKRGLIRRREDGALALTPQAIEAMVVYTEPRRYRSPMARREGARR